MASKFSVEDVPDEVFPGASSGAHSQGQVTSSTDSRLSNSVKGAIENRTEENNGDTYTPLIKAGATEDSNDLEKDAEAATGRNLALYEEEFKTRPKLSSKLSSLRLRYDPTPANPKTLKKSKKKGGAKMGTLMGVYLPCLQNILGVILFLRLTWIVGTAGWVQAFFIVLICCITTVLTAISLSAIVTNGVVPAGGPYFLISRNLGPELGGAIGILFYLGNTFAASLYILGAIELLVKYIAPQMVFFGDPTDRANLFNSMRIYGTLLLLLLALIVFVGVKFVNYFASFALVCVIISVATIYFGAFDPRPRVPLCVYNNTALKGALEDFQCPADPMLFDTFCLRFNATTKQSVVDNSINLYKSCCPDNPNLQIEFNGTGYDMGWNFENCIKGLDSAPCEPLCISGIPGITRTLTMGENVGENYLKEGDSEPGEDSIPNGNQIVASVTSSFLILIGIFFPSVTGIMAGTNRSGDLKNPQRSIPIGTLSAILTTTIIYLTCVLFFGGTMSGPLLRDQLGDATGGLGAALLSWPSEWVVLIGALLSTIGAALQTLTGAPRLLQAIAIDGIIPIMKIFSKTFRNEPTIALILTVVLAEVGILIAVLDYVAPILTMFFLMLYLSVNASTALQSLLKSPNWRPRFRFYHWTLSVLGALMCLVLMFIVSWYYALGAIAIALVLYKYIEYRGAEKEWGDGLRGLSLQAARYSLLKLEETTTHTKNWRPQLLVLMKLDVNYLPSQPKLLSFASQLKPGKGLTLVTSILEGRSVDMKAEAIAAKETLKRFVNDNKIEGFCDVLVSPDLISGIATSIQCAGLGVLKPNSVLVSWPDAWRRKATWKIFLTILNAAAQKDMAVLVSRGINWYPSNEDKARGSIDVWWIVHDGGLLMLLPFLLRQNKVWKRCSLRIFSVAQIDDNSIQMKKDLEAFLYELRISAEVKIIEMPDQTISDYTYERTLIMEQRSEMLRQMRLTQKDKLREVQSLMAASYTSKRGSLPADQKVDISSFEDEPRVIGRREPVPSQGTRDPSSTDVPMIVVTEDPCTSDTEEPDRVVFSVPLSTSVHSQMDKLQVSSPNFQATEPHERNVLRMNTSVKLNELIVENSDSAQLVIVNLPGPPSAPNEEENYMEFLDVLTEGLDRVLMVRGGGREVITIYS